jgi:hypothetical protein
LYRCAVARGSNLRRRFPERTQASHAGFPERTQADRVLDSPNEPSIGPGQTGGTGGRHTGFPERTQLNVPLGSNWEHWIDWENTAVPPMGRRGLEYRDIVSPNEPNDGPIRPPSGLKRPGWNFPERTQRVPRDRDTLISSGPVIPRTSPSGQVAGAATSPNEPSVPFGFPRTNPNLRRVGIAHHPKW